MQPRKTSPHFVPFGQRPRASCSALSQTRRPVAQQDNKRSRLAGQGHGNADRCVQRSRESTTSREWIQGPERTNHNIPASTHSGSQLYIFKRSRFSSLTIKSVSTRLRDVEPKLCQHPPPLQRLASMAAQGRPSPWSPKFFILLTLLFILPALVGTSSLFCVRLVASRLSRLTIYKSDSGRLSAHSYSILEILSPSLNKADQRIKLPRRHSVLKRTELNTKKDATSTDPPPKFDPGPCSK